MLCYNDYDNLEFKIFLIGCFCNEEIHWLVITVFYTVSEALKPEVALLTFF